MVVVSEDEAAEVLADTVRHIRQPEADRGRCQSNRK